MGSGPIFLSCDIERARVIFTTDSFMGSVR